ncbi:MAG: DUF429 domain-containing protein [Gammaproteobacteria bacterium]
MNIAGVDGCPGGWFYAAVEKGRTSWGVVADVDALMRRLRPPRLVAIDIPIGLPDAGPRACDQEARRALGRRGSSVFPAPVRPVLEAGDYEDACRIRRKVEGKAMSRQAWHIVPRIASVDRWLRQCPERAAELVEVHPELCFREMAGGPLAWPKRRPRGRQERLELLRPFFRNTPDAALGWRRGRAVAADDVLDAFAALWSAKRIVEGRALCMPGLPPRDRFGLPMRIMA